MAEKICYAVIQGKDTVIMEPTPLRIMKKHCGTII
jgi:hypothetical protein